MSPEVSLAEHAVPLMQPAELQPLPEIAPPQPAVLIPQLHEAHHEHHEQRIAVREGHACQADCPEHLGSHPVHPAEEQNGHEHPPFTIIQKTAEHACGADCPDHIHKPEHHDREHHEPHPQIELKASHACGPDCPEHAASASTLLHPHHHDQPVRPTYEQAAKEDPPAIIPKPLAQACHVDHPDEVLPPQPADQVIEQPTPLSSPQAPALAEILHPVTPLPLPEKPPVFATDTITPVIPEPSVVFPETTPTLAEKALPQKAIAEDTPAIAFSLPEVLDAAPEITPPTLTMETVNASLTEDEPVLPPVIEQPLSVTVSSISESIIEQYNQVTARVARTESQDLPPPNLVELQQLVTAIASRTAQAECSEASLRMTTPECKRILRLLGFETEATERLFAEYTRQYGQQFYDELFSQLLELLASTAAPAAPSVQQVGWAAILGRTALLLNILFRHLGATPPQGSLLPIQGVVRYT